MADGLILVTGWPGQPSVQELEEQAIADVRPRTDYVELARRLGADVVDAVYMRERATPLARSVARLGGLAQGQLIEALLRERRYQWVLTWADHLGFRLAALNQLTRRHTSLVLVSVRLGTLKKGLLLRRFRLHKQFRAIVGYGSEQLARAAEYGIPESKLRLLLQPVDECFWRSAGLGEEGAVCAVGWEARDYGTLARAVEGVPVRVEIALGSSVLSEARTADLGAEVGGLPNLAVHKALPHHRLRELYERARVVVVPLHDVDYDAGVTAITEAMAMAKPLVVTRTRGQVDVVRDGAQAVLVPPNNPPALREALLRLLEDPDTCLRMGAAGRALAEKHHRLDGYVDELAEIVTEATG